MRIEKQTYLNVASVGSGRTIAGVELVRCAFTASTLSQFDDPGLGLVVRDVTATRCVASRSFLQGVCLDNVLVDGLTTKSRLELNGCALRHVTLRGRVGSWGILPPNFSMPHAMQAAFTAALIAYYKDVDWALDISQAEFDSAPSIYYVPGHLVRRDPNTQFLLRRDAVADVDPASLPDFASIAISRFEATPFDSLVAVAPTRSKKFPKILAHYQELRDRGLAD